MMRKEERPGGESEALKKSLTGDYLDSNRNRQALDAIRRRREAALRLPPLASGRRDPLFDWERVGA